MEMGPCSEHSVGPRGPGRSPSCSMGGALRPLLAGAPAQAGVLGAGRSEGTLVAPTRCP